DGGTDTTDRIVKNIQKRLRVSAKDNSSLISVQFEFSQPATASMIVNAVMNAYLANANATRAAQVGRTNDWVLRQSAAYRADIESLEKRIADFLQENNIPEVQGSYVAAIQLNKVQEQLVAAREELVRQQAALDTVSRGGGHSIAGATEALESKTIQTLKEFDIKLSEQISRLAPTDPRRINLEAALRNVQARMNRETQLVFDAAARNVEVARARVQSLEQAVQGEAARSQSSTIAGQTLRQLTAELDAKRQHYSTFLANAEQVRLAAVQAPTAHLLYEAVTPQRPAMSFGILSLVFGFIGGLLGSSGLIVLRNSMGTRINSTSDLALATGLPILGALPEIQGSRMGGLRQAARIAPLMTETFRAMWVRMRPQQSDGTVILVTSSEIGEGKTTVATSMARQFGNDGFRVLLVDADLRHPNIARVLNRRPVRGLEAVLEGRVTLEGAVAVDPVSGIDCLLATGGTNASPRLFSSAEFKQLLNTARRLYDFVILDSPPVLHVADPVLMASQCRFVLFVVQASRMAPDLVMEAVHRFYLEDREKIHGLLTRTPPRDLAAPDYYSGYTSPSRSASLPVIGVRR
ncbi:MAG: GumC family protein, partial [Acetobacteraceae bacterium]